jgi:hypothetical protein
MQTCRHCLSEDIPDGATHCRHCGRRLKPTHIARNIIIGIVIFIALALYINFARESAARDEERFQARSEIDTVKVWCSPETPEDFVEARTKTFEQKVDAMDLEMEEKQGLNSAFANQLELHGCGFTARNQPKKKRR